MADSILRLEHILGTFWLDLVLCRLSLLQHTVDLFQLVCIILEVFQICRLVFRLWHPSWAPGLLKNFLCVVFLSIDVFPPN